MSYKPLADLTTEEKNCILCHRIRINGACGVCFVLDDTHPMWFTEIDVVVQAPDVPDSAKQNRNLHICQFLQKFGTRPLDNRSDMEDFVREARLAIEDIVCTDIINLDDDILDEMQWHLTFKSNENVGFYITISPVLRSGNPVTRNAVIGDYNLRPYPSGMPRE